MFNDIIGYNKVKHEFISKEDLLFVECGNYSSILLDILGGYDEDITLLYGTGKTDIDGNKIYADSSIVEFEFDSGFPYYDSLNLVGYFQYNSYKLRYELIVLENKSSDEKYDNLDFDIEMTEDFKIIDTLQENKLGLYDAK